MKSVFPGCFRIFVCETWILLLPGDGIGPEVVREAKKVLEVVEAYALQLEFREANLGGAAIDAEAPLTRLPLKPQRKSRCDTAWSSGWSTVGQSPGSSAARAGLLAIRADLDLFCNLRPALLFPELAGASSLRRSE